jgi:hypothetical protein
MEALAIRLRLNFDLRVDDEHRRATNAALNNVAGLQRRLAFGRE